MYDLNWLNKLKKKLRLKRRWLAFAVAALLVGGGVWTISQWTDGWKLGSEANDIAVFGRGGEPEPTSGNAAPKEVERQLAIIRDSGIEREAYMKRTYVCGEELSHLGRLSAEQLMDVFRGNPQLTVAIDAGGSVTFMEKIDDLSPQCKTNAYFGMDEQGNLSLFDGVPGKDNVIRTFFQLNISHLESSLPREAVKQLYRGIQVKDLDEYNSVISTFSDYALEETEKAMTQTGNAGK